MEGVLDGVIRVHSDRRHASRVDNRGESTEQLSLEQVLSQRRWQRTTAHPELRKALAEIQTYVVEARWLLAREPEADHPYQRAKVEEQLADLLRVDVHELKIDDAWELANKLKRTLLLLGDASYISALLEQESSRKPRPRDNWSDHLREAELIELCKRGRAGTLDREAHARAVDRLTLLYRARADSGRSLRAIAAQKCRYLRLLAPILCLFLAGAGVSLSLGADETWHAVVVATAAGALGATLSGVRTVRDSLAELKDLRAFSGTMSIQPLVGATSGLLLFLLVEAGALPIDGVDLSSAATLGLLAFVAGFSEPFLLGLVERNAVISSKQPETRTS
jgi:hypothetical protein